MFVKFMKTAMTNL